MWTLKACIILSGDRNNSAVVDTVIIGTGCSILENANKTCINIKSRPIQEHADGERQHNGRTGFIKEILSYEE